MQAVLIHRTGGPEVLSFEQAPAGSATSPCSSRNTHARAIGTGSSRNRDFVLGLGAEEYVDYAQQDVGEAVSGVDVAFDTVGGETTDSESGHTRGKIILTVET